MVAAFLISLPALQGNVSVLQSVAEEPAAPTVETAPAAVDSNSNAAPAEASNSTAPATNTAPASNAASSEASGVETPANN